jgi:hypothetical protein
MKFIIALILLCAALVGAYGLLATLEPMDAARRAAWRAIYGVGGAACLIGAVWLLVSAIKRTRS